VLYLAFNSDLEFIFRVPIRNTMIKNVEDLKRHMKFHLNLWLCPFKGWTEPPCTVMRYIPSDAT
jgi:hypothetical protein